MNKRYAYLAMALGLAAAVTGTARADGNTNAIIQPPFGSLLSTDAATAPAAMMHEERSRSSEAVPTASPDMAYNSANESERTIKVTRLSRRALTRSATNPFRDDTAD